MRSNVRVWLACLSGHLNRFPHLDQTVTTIYGYRHEVLVGTDYGTQNLRVLADWARTLTNVSAVGITGTSGERTNLRICGRLTDSTEVAVSSNADPDDSDLLAANTLVEKGATFPVDLLLRLTAADAEAVARG